MSPPFDGLLNSVRRQGGASATAPPFRRKLLFEALEPRVLLSADLNPAATEEASGPAPLVQNVAPQQPNIDFAAAIAQQVPRAIVFVDPRVADFQQLIDGLPEASNTETFLLDAARNGVQQITEFLEGHDGVAAIHVVSHGSAQGLALGNSLLNASTLDSYADQLAAWREAFSSDADILLYGCNVAADEQGVTFIQELAALTGADVAASSDLTGSSALGGDWSLESHTGAIESSVLYAGSDYAHVLDGSFQGFKEGEAVAEGLFDGTLDFTDARFDRLELAGVTGMVTVKFLSEGPIEIVNGSDKVTAKGLKDIVVGGSAATTVLFEKGADISGVTVELQVGNSARTVTFSSNPDNPDGSFVKGETTRVTFDATATVGQYTARTGDGTVTLKGFEGANFVGGIGPDMFVGGADDEHVVGGKGDDYLSAGDGNDKLSGGEGDDRLFGEDGGDALFGGDGKDVLRGGAGDDGSVLFFFADEATKDSNGLHGGDGDDNLYGDTGNDWLFGEDGADKIEGGAGDDVLVGGDGNDRYVFLDAFGRDFVVETSGEGKDSLDFGLVTADLKITIGGAADEFEFFSIQGAAEDHVTASARIETLIAGTGTNSYKVAQYFFDNFDPDGFLNRTLTIVNRLGDGGAATAILDLSGVTQALAVSVERGSDAAVENVVTVEFESGSPFTANKKLIMLNVAGLKTGTGNDVLLLGDGVELAGSVELGAGNDQVTFGEGTNIALDLDGGDGRNLIVYQGKTTGVDFTFGAEDFPRVGGETLNFQSVTGTSAKDVIFGDDGANTLTGNDGGDRLSGAGGDDTLASGDGEDELDGGGGDDSLTGGDGKDKLTGGAGDDTLDGGGDEDTYVFDNDWGKDVIVSHFFDRQQDIVDLSRVTDALQYSIADDKIKIGAGTFDRDAGLFGFVYASGNFAAAVEDTVTIGGSGVGGFFGYNVSKILTGAADQTLYFGNSWSSLDIDASGTSTAGKVIKLDFSGASVPLRFTFDRDPADKGGKTFLRIDNLDGVAASVLDLVGKTDHIIVRGIDERTEIITGSNSNTLQVKNNADFKGKVVLLDGPQYSSVPLTDEIALPSGLRIEDGLDFTQGLGDTFRDLKAFFSKPSSAAEWSAVTHVDLLKGVVDNDKASLGSALGEITDFAHFLPLAKQVFSDPKSTTFLQNELGAVTGIGQLELRAGQGLNLPATIRDIAYGAGINIIRGDDGNNTFSHGSMRPGLDLLSGLSGADTYKFGTLWGAGAVIETPDLEIGGQPIPEALDTLDFSPMFGGDVTVDVYDFSLVRSSVGLIDGLDFSDWADVGTNFLVVRASNLVGSTFADLIPGAAGGIADLLRNAATNFLIATDIESLVGPKFGNLTVRLHGDAELRGTVENGLLGTVTLDYSDYGAPVTVTAGTSLAGSVLAALGLGGGDDPGSGGFDYTEFLDKLGISGVLSSLGLDELSLDTIGLGWLPETANAGATGIGGHRLGGLTTIADVFGEDNVVSQTLAASAVSGLTKVIHSPQADTFTNDGSNVTFVGGPEDNVAFTVLDLLSTDETEGFRVDLATGDVRLGGATELYYPTPVTTDRVISGKGNDRLEGSSADEVFVFSADPVGALTPVDWGIDDVSSGGGHDTLDFRDVPDGWIGHLRDTEKSGLDYVEIYFTDSDGAEVVGNKVLIANPATGTVDAFKLRGNIDTTGFVPATVTFSVSPLMSEAAATGLAITEVPAAIIDAAMQAFDNLVFQVPRTDGSGSDDFTLEVETIGSALQLRTPSGGVLLDSTKLKLVVTDLPDRQLSSRLPDGTIFIDATAADHGWFTGVGATPPTGSGRMDLLSVVVHELAQRIRVDGLASTLSPEAVSRTLATTAAQSANPFNNAPLVSTALPAGALTAVDATVQAVIAEAKARWEAADLRVAGSAAGAVTVAMPVVEFRDLGPGELGRSLADGTILLDVTAAGHGWFVDTFATDDDVEAGRIDLLTVVMHEMGHRLGAGHDLVSGSADLMDETLAAGVRLALPDTPIEVLTAESSDEAKFALGLEAFGGWVAGLGTLLDSILNASATVPLLGDVSLASVFNLDADAGTRLAAGLQQNITDRIASLFAGASPPTNQDIAALDFIDFAQSTSGTAYSARVDLPGLVAHQEINLDPSNIGFPGLSLSSGVPPVLDVDVGLYLEFTFGLDAAGEFYVDEPGVVASLSVDSGAEPFDIGVNIGPIGLAIQGGSIDIGAEMRLGTDAHLSYEDLAANRLDPLWLMPTLGAGAHWDIDLPLALTGLLAGLSGEDIAFRAHGEVGGGVGGLESLLAGIEFQAPNLSDILNFQGLSLDLILDNLQAALDALLDSGALNKDLPLVGQSVVDLLGDGAVAFATQLRNIVSEVRESAQNIGELQDDLNAALVELFDLAPDAQPVSLLYEDSVFSFDLDLQALAERAIALALDAEDLQLEQILGFDPAELLALRASALIDLSASADLHVGFDFDLSDLIAGPQFFLDPDTGIAAQVSASADNLDFQIGLDLGNDITFGMVAADGTVAIDLGLSADLSNEEGDANGDGAVQLSELADSFQIEAQGSANLELPLYFPIKALPLGGTSADRDGDGYGDNVLHAGAAFSIDVLDFDLQTEFDYSLPAFGLDFDAAAALVGLLNDPATLLAGLEGFFSGVDKVADGIDFIELPLVGGKPFDDLAGSIRGLRSDVLGAKVGDEYQGGSACGCRRRRRIPMIRAYSKMCSTWCARRSTRA